jgi:hypothetical protein
MREQEKKESKAQEMGKLLKELKKCGYGSFSMPEIPFQKP